jgi:uncharacterized membrane protein
MMYLALKTFHILSSTVFFGTGLGTAFFMFMANRSGNRQAMHQIACLAPAEPTLPNAYRRYEHAWTLLGIPAFCGLVVVFWLMTAKPF